MRPETGSEGPARPFLYSNGTITALPEPSDFTTSGCQAAGMRRG